MKNIKFIFFAVLVASFVSFNANAQVTREFSDIISVPADYQDIQGESWAKDIDEEADLVEIPISSGKVDLDDGYVKVPIGFPFDFNGETFEHLFINVNGFVTFGRMENGFHVEPPYLTVTTRQPENAFFQDDDSYPVNVIAPYWGDHQFCNEEMSFQDYLQSFITYGTTRETDEFTGLENDVFVVQWKNLNINYLLDDKKVKSSVANFQLRLYKSVNAYSGQGDIEFCYGQVGGNDKVEDTRILTNGAVIGIKGFKQPQGDAADYLNGLTYGFYPTATDYDAEETIETASENLGTSKEWQPSGATNRRIRFISAGKAKEADWWGDGDVDFSKVIGGAHYNLNDGTPKSQKFWVTANDARTIMVSIATETPLEPTIEREAYHGDVNHNGRYFYNSKGDKVKLPWQSEKYTDDLDHDDAKEISNPKQQILFEVTTSDAADILSFLSGNYPQLPWILPYGGLNKITNDVDATTITMGEVTKLTEGLSQFPVFVNGNLTGSLAIDFKVNGTVENVIANIDGMMTQHTDSKVVVAATGNFNPNTPVCYVNVRLDNETVELTNVNFNDTKVNDVINAAVNVQDETASFSVTPNVVKDYATVNMNLNNAGNYNVALFDMTGRKVAEIYSGQLTVGNNTIPLDVTSLNHGIYILKAEGSNVVKTTKVVVE
jgi:hypothetical protein